ncbi:MAG TPA: galactokinase [Bryobacteraceae bacterium]|jgi:galactokinase|nr:galactokinase [Bryobacteraceae bacterium]
MIEAFRRLYGSADGVRVFRAPGRVNLIGEHTDYNLGFVLPVALDLATYIATAPAADGKLRIHSEDRQESAEWPVAEIAALTPRRHWTDYPIGVAQELIRGGSPVEPANLLVRSTVPEGSGLSSSAALEVSAAMAMLAGRRMAPLELARLCQNAERNFVGMPCGIMDQYISVFGEERAAICIDCRSLKHQVVRLPEGAAFLAVNTMVKHELAGSAYKERTEQCAAAVQAVRRRHPRVESLRDVTPAMYEETEPSMEPIIARRARHVVSEDARVVQFVAACREGAVDRMGELFEASHRSLQHDYEVSCDELDFLVDAALGVEGVYGARMTGGGFGGCTVTLIRPDAVEHFEREITRLYHERFGIRPQVYPVRPSWGAEEEKNLERIPAAAQLLS